jgi:hypothetical protein
MLLAVAIVGITDRSALGPIGAWSIIRDALPLRATTTLERGLATDQIELRRLAEAENRSRVVVMGSSRANAAFSAEWVSEEGLDRLVFAKLAHGGVGPFELRVMAEEVLAVEPDVVVFVLSEFETHHPFSIVPYGLPFRWSAIVDLAVNIEGRFFVQNRTRILRMIAARVSRIYRFREVIRKGLVADTVRFEVDAPRLSSEPRQAGIWARRDWRHSAVSSSGAATERLFSAARTLLPNIPPVALRVQARQITAIQRGPDTHLQEALLWSTFERFREHGVEVIVIEAPLHPVALDFVVFEARWDFRRFLGRAEERLGTRTVFLEESGPFGPEAFNDLTHLNGAAGKRLTRRIAEEALLAVE